MRADFLFLDGETLQAEVEHITLDRLELEVTPTDVNSNNQRVEVAVPAIKMIVQPARPEEEARARADLKAGKLRRMVVHFRDGDRLRCYQAEMPLREQYGTTLLLVQADDEHIERVSIPYTAVKAIFQVHSFNSRLPEPERAGDESGKDEKGKARGTAPAVKTWAEALRERGVLQGPGPNSAPRAKTLTELLEERGEP